LDFEQKTGVKILDSADDLKNELLSNSTDLSKEASPAKLKQQDLAKKLSE